MVVRVHSSPHISLICINTIENCRYLARAVYGKGRQFNSINELTECILFEWEKVNKKKSKDLFINAKASHFNYTKFWRLYKN